VILRVHGIKFAAWDCEQVLHPLDVKTQEARHRQIAQGIVMALKEGQLLSAAGRVIGRAQVDGSVPRPPVRPAAKSLFYCAIVQSGLFSEIALLTTQDDWLSSCWGSSVYLNRRWKR
jgi:hypothetical protein